MYESIKYKASGELYKAAQQILSPCRDHVWQNEVKTAGWREADARKPRPHLSLQSLAVYPALGWLVQLNCCTWLPGDEIQLKERKRLWGPQCSSPLWKYKWIGCQMHCSVQSSKTQSALQSVISSESHVGNVVSPHKEPRDAAAGFLSALDVSVGLLRLWPLNSQRPH